MGSHAHRYSGHLKKKAISICEKFPNARQLLKLLDNGEKINIKGIGKKNEESIKEVFSGN